MDDGPVPRSFKGHTYVRNFITSTLLMAAMAAEAQEQQVLQSISDDDPKTTISSKANPFAPSIEDDIINLYGTLEPYMTVKIKDDYGYYTEVIGSEILAASNSKFTTITETFMTVLGRKLGNGATLVFKAADDLSERELGFYTFSNTSDDTLNTEILGAPSERIIFGYIKNNEFTELGIIGSNDRGFYAIPNLQQSDFWAQNNRTLLEKCGITISSTEVIYLDNQNTDTPQTNLSLRAWQDFLCG